MRTRSRLGGAMHNCAGPLSTTAGSAVAAHHEQRVEAPSGLQRGLSLDKAEQVERQCVGRERARRNSCAPPCVASRAHRRVAKGGALRWLELRQVGDLRAYGNGGGEGSREAERAPNRPCRREREGERERKRERERGVDREEKRKGEKEKATKREREGRGRERGSESERARERGRASASETDSAKS
eukprot:1319724-Pleurochrysis_carterae.AAC.6